MLKRDLARAGDSREMRVTMIDQEMPGAQDTIYLCNFRVSVDGEWLCLKEMHDVEYNAPEPTSQTSTPSPDEPIQPLGMTANT